MTASDQRRSDILIRLTNGGLSGARAALLLDVSLRHVRRLATAYALSGMASIPYRRILPVMSRYAHKIRSAAEKSCPKERAKSNLASHRYFDQPQTASPVNDPFWVNAIGASKLDFPTHRPILLSPINSQESSIICSQRKKNTTQTSLNKLNESGATSKAGDMNRNRSKRITICTDYAS